MQGNKKTSSSEQYTKKSNRTLLFGGIILLLVFLTMLVLMSGGKKVQEEEQEPDWTNDQIEKRDSEIVNGDLFSRGNAQLKAEPSQIDMNNVVLGSKVEAILTLTAEEAPIQYRKAEFVQQQADGFTIETTCSPDTPIDVGKNCIIKVLWNPIALQQLQNNLVITWKEASNAVVTEKTTTVLVKGQSTDSKDCVICEDIRKQESIEPKMAMGLDGKLHPIDEDGTITIDGKKYKMTENGVFIDENGNIVAIAPPEYIALNMQNELMGTVSDANEVIDANGENIGKTLGDKTIVDSKLTVLGAAVPVLSVMDTQGKVIGKMTKEGTVIDGAGTVIGKVWVDHRVFSIDGQFIGYIRPWGLVADFSGKILGAIIPDGTVINGNNETIANITPNGFAINAQGELIGATIPQGVAVGPGCQSLGKVLQNGDVRDSYDQVIGKALIDGTIVNTANEEIGSVISQGLVINEKGEIIGYVNSEGKAVSNAGKVIGCINPDGTISAGKKFIGAVLTTGHVIGYSCGTIGTVFPNGEVYNNALHSVGHVMPDGLVKSAENKIIGVVVTRAAAVADGCRLLGLVSINGQVLDLTNQPVGCITPEKTVVNEKGEKLGSLAPRGIVHKDDGTVLGRIRLDGKVMDLEGKVIGCVNADGSITSLNGEILAHAPTQDGIIMGDDGNPAGWTRVGNDVYDQYGNKIGTVNKNNVIVDASGKYIGFIPPDGIIFSPDGLILGRYSSKVGYATNQANERFGKVLSNMAVVSAETGEVVGGLVSDKTSFFNQAGEVIGQLTAEGVLKNSSGEVAGAVRGDGTVIDKDGNIIGWRVPTGDVFSTTGKFVGTVTETGNVLSSGRTKIGTVLGNGIAVSTDGKILGGVLPKMALAMDADGLVGYLAPDGKITNNSGAVIGLGTPFGPVISSEGEVIAKLIGLNVYVDAQNKTVGWLSFDSSLKNKENRNIGFVTPNRMAFDKTNQLLGSEIQSGVVIDETGKMVSVMSVNNKVLQKDKFLGAGSASPYVYATDDRPMGHVLQPGVGIGNDGLLIGWTRMDGSIGNRSDSLGNVLFDNHIINEKGAIIGTYVPFGSVAFDDTGKTLGVIGNNGELVNNNDISKGKIHASDIVVQNGEILGKLMCELPFVSNNLLGKMSGLAQYNGTVISMTNKKTIGNLLPNNYVTSMNGQVVAGATAQGIPVTNSYTSLGQAYVNGITALKSNPTGKVSGIAVVYDEHGKVIGSILPSATFISKTGTHIGKTSAGRVITDKQGKQVALQMNSDYALTSDNIWAGGVLPKGLVVNDNAEPIGTIMPDGIVLDSADSIVGRVLADKAVIEVTDKELFNTMPYIGSTVAQGMPFSYRGKVLGVTTLNGDVKDTSGEKIFKILDDGTILGKDEPLAGAILPFLTATGYKGEVLGVLAGDGKVLSPDGESKGTIAVNEAVKASELKIVGILIPTKLITNDCKVIGVTSYNGQVVDAKGTVIGHIKPDKWAVNAAGQQIGRVTRTGLVIAENGDYLGRTLSDSTVVDTSGVNLGCAKNDGSVVDNNGNVIGNVVERGLVLGKDGKPIGRVKANGEVVNKDGGVIGKVLANGNVVDKNGNVIGHNVSRDQELLFDDDGNIKGTFGTDGTFYDPKTGKAVFKVDGETGNVYDPQGNLIGKLDEKTGGITTLDGETLDNLTMLVDKDGNVFGIVSGCDVKNNLGEKIGSILANGNVVDLNGDVFAKILGDGTILDKDGNEMGHVAGTDTRLDKCGIKSIEPEYQVEKNRRNIYDKDGNLIGWIDENGNLYDKDGNLIGRVDKDGNVYDKDGNLIGRIDKDGNFYDKDGNLIGKVSKGTRNIYDKDGNLIGWVDENGNLYDKDGNLIGRVDKDGNVYDKDGNLIGRIDKDGNFYDKNGNLIGKVSKGGRNIYDKNGNLIGWIDENGNLYDKDGNLIGRVDENGNIYDKDGNLIGRIDKNTGEITMFGKGFGNGANGSGGGIGVAGRKIIIGNKKYNVSEKGSIISDDGTIIGYMGEDGKPYTLDNRMLTASGDVAGRSRPDVKQTQKLTPEQAKQIKDLLTQKRENMRVSITERGKITANGQIQAMSRPKKDKKWKGVGAIVSSWPVDMSRVILKDKAIPAVIVRSVDSRFSDVPVTAIVERHVYAEQGRNILIPAGSRVIGKMSQGDNGDKVAKMEISWERLIRPDGGAFSFAATSGDAQGRGGVAAYLDDQLINKYGKPVMTSVVTSAVSYMMAANDDYQANLETGTTTQSSKSEAVNDARKSFIGAMDRIFNNLISEATEIPNVVFVPSGTRVTIFSNQDLWLRSEDDDVEEYQQSDDFMDMSSIQKPKNDSWIDQRNQDGAANEGESDNKGTPQNDNDKNNQNDKNDQQQQEELPNYYAPNDAYKSGHNTASSPSNPVYDGGSQSENTPLKDRTVAPVLPRTGSTNSLF